MKFVNVIRCRHDIFLVEADPKNYLSYFRRATVYLAMGKSKSALPDLTKVIELKPDFIAVSSFVA